MMPYAYMLCRPLGLFFAGLNGVQPNFFLSRQATLSSTPHKKPSIIWDRDAMMNDEWMGRTQHATFETAAAEYKIFSSVSFRSHSFRVCSAVFSSLSLFLGKKTTLIG